MKFPLYGPIANIWKLVMLIHSFIYTFIWPLRIATPDYLTWFLVVFDMYCNIIFFIDIIITFLTPFVDYDCRIITGNKKIA